MGATIDWGDGTTSPGGQSQDGQSFTGTHTYGEQGSYNGSVAYTCPLLQGTQHQSFTATVQDAGLTGAERDSSGTAGQSLSAVVAHIDDANPAADPSDFSAQINWGDGTSSAGTVAAAAGGGFDVTGTHTYSTAGSYPVSITITDVGGSLVSASSTTQIRMPRVGGPGHTDPLGTVTTDDHCDSRTPLQKAGLAALNLRPTLLSAQAGSLQENGQGASVLVRLPCLYSALGCDGELELDAVSPRHSRRHRHTPSRRLGVAGFLVGAGHSSATVTVKLNAYGSALARAHKLGRVTLRLVSAGSNGRIAVLSKTISLRLRRVR